MEAAAGPEDYLSVEKALGNIWRSLRTEGKKAPEMGTREGEKYRPLEHNV
jgi:hypothetical protein